MHLGALFIASHVLTSGSVRETARRFQLSPSTVSTAIHNLETELAMKLTERASGELATLIASGRVLEGLEPIMAAIGELGQWAGHDGAGAEIDEAWTSRIPVKIVTMERFLEVADQGSINRAARRLRLGQPQLSLQLANLEKFLRHRLFERQAQG
ncbi:LysR family transcriptional regulator, partial [Rhizobium ruizarguesonis]